MVKQFFSDKRYGFYVTIVSMVMSIVAAIVYVMSYHAYVNFMSWTAFVMFLVGVVLSVILLVLRRYTFATLILFAGDLLGLLFYVRHIYSYVQVVVAGVDIASFSSNFILSTVFISIAFVLSIVSVFLPQCKPSENTQSSLKEAE